MFISTYIASLIGVPQEQIKLILTILLVYPFCLINYNIKGYLPRLLYSLILGIFFQYSIYGMGTIHILISTIATYLFINYYGRKLSAFYVMIGTISYLSFLHISRMIYDYGGWTIDDVTTIYMMTICKFSSLAFSYEDGGKPISDLKNSHHKEYRLENKPSFLEVLSFVYFYPTSIIGPSIEFKDFINFIKEEDCYAHLKENKSFLIQTSIKYLLSSFLTMFIYVFGSYIPIRAMGEPDFGNHNLLYKIAYLYFVFPSIRAKYYSGWLISYSTLILNGISYTERKNKENQIVKSFDKGDYGSIISSEFEPNAKNKLIEWNKTIHLWLKYNIYTRTINIDKKPFKNNWQLASLLTFIGSALWHGYYPTYYFTFLMLYFIQFGNDALDKTGFYEDYVDKSLVLKIIMSFITQISINSIGVPFFNLEWKLFIQYLINMRFFPLFMAFGYYSLRYMNLPKKEKNKPKKEEKKDSKKDN
jgi:hypothetical protein